MLPVLLLALTTNVIAEVPSGEERAAILDCHARLREGVKPIASNMLLLTYSTEMEKLADEYVKACTGAFPASSPRFRQVGYIQLPSSDQQLEYRDALLQVDDSAYVYRNNTCLGSCYDYKQVRETSLYT
ncbi:unnamed protein product [Mesocestoides corti]|uniref:SCP domain-containing protein n=1 Tax=Mesocestoides corti TaxID=53468 RepID=A0A0R3UMH8_MESCO|nr:unnamed protein product [Mesocestoides corti]